MPSKDNQTKGRLATSTIKIAQPSNQEGQKMKSCGIIMGVVHDDNGPNPLQTPRHLPPSSPVTKNAIISRYLVKVYHGQVLYNFLVNCGFQSVHRQTDQHGRNNNLLQLCCKGPRYIQLFVLISISSVRLDG